MIRLLHTGDIHLGKKFVHLGDRGKAHRNSIKKTVSAIVDLAIQREVHGVLFAGDIFDSHIISEIDLSFFVAELSRLWHEDIYTCIIAGNHDYFTNTSVYAQEVFSQNEKCILFSPNKTSHVIPEIDLTVFGVSCTSQKSTRSPLSFFDPAYTTAHGIALIHGSFAIPEKHTPDSYPFTLEEIEASGLDYIACGDWHSFLELPSKKTKAVYSGSPEALDFDQLGSGKVAMIEIGDEVVVTPVHVGAYSFVELELDVTGVENVGTYIEKEVSKYAGEHVIFSLSLSGLVRPDSLISARRIEEDLEDHFYVIRVRDFTSVEITDDALRAYPDTVVSGKFIRIMSEKIARAASIEEKEVLEKALQVGLQQLEGRI